MFEKLRMDPYNVNIYQNDMGGVGVGVFGKPRCCNISNLAPRTSSRLQVIFIGTLATRDLQWAPAVGIRPQNLANASHSCTVQPMDDTLGDDKYVPSTHTFFQKDCGPEEPIVGDNEEPRPQCRSESSVDLRCPRNASRESSVDSQMQIMSKYLE
ncbi:hypothetical protein HHK36_010623 [Tetracentron sinense]|uniref:Uncharacterized protein n=1 Tax=Tetracentron sinense TaxID=13715 RepID=A0A835DGH7_TETSI|nr:hypothetical protein HHK36_010623 [Tetracentron sinense]